MALESSITKSIIKYMNSLPDCKAEKVKGSSSSSGRPDINACYKGRCLRIEVKTEDHNNKPSEKQKRNLERWSKAGAVTMVVYTKEDVKEFLDLIDDEEYKGKTVVKPKKLGLASWVKIP